MKIIQIYWGNLSTFWVDLYIFILSLCLLVLFVRCVQPPLYSEKACIPTLQWPTLLIAGNCHLLTAQHQKWGSTCYEGSWLALSTSGPYATSFYRGARTRRLRLLGVAFVRPIMNSPSFVEGGSFLCWHPQNWDRCVAGEVVRRKVDVRGKRAIYEPTLPLWGGGFEPRLNFKRRFVDTRLTVIRRLSPKQEQWSFHKNCHYGNIFKANINRKKYIALFLASFSKITRLYDQLFDFLLIFCSQIIIMTTNFKRKFPVISSLIFIFVIY